MEIEKLLTFVVPTYNMEEYLEHCIRSCVCDNMRYLEIIIVNDGSKDNSSEIGHKLESEFSGIVYVIDKKNGHYGSCVNCAINVAKGKYFRMLDPDDWCNSFALNSLLEILKNSNTDLLVTVSEDRLFGKQLVTRMDIPSKVVEGKIYDAKSFDGIAYDFKWFFCSHVLTYKTDVLRSIGLRLQEGICYTDNEYVFYPLDKISTIAFYNLPLYQYYVGRCGASTSTGGSLKMQQEMWKVLEKMFLYYYDNYNNNTLAVRNNQRILISEVAKWILSPIFLYCKRMGKESEDIVQKVQSLILKDQKLLTMMKKHFENAPAPLYKYYCRTGKIWNFTPLICTRLLYFHIKKKVAKRGM